MNERDVSIPPIPRCRPPIKKMTAHMDSTNNKKSVKHRDSVVEYHDSALAYHDSTTDSESSTEDELPKSYKTSISPIRKNDISQKESKNVSEISPKIQHYFLNDLMMTIFGCLFVLLACILYFYMSLDNYNNELIQDLQKSREDLIQDFHKSVDDIKVKFKHQKLSTWNTISSQIEDIVNESAQVSMVILLGNETNTVTCLAHALGEISRKVLGSNTYLTLNKRNMDDNYGKTISRLKAEIPIMRAVVVENLQTISPKAIQTFHSLCDKENPLVSKAFYIITIVSSGYEGTHKDKFVEDQLTETFSKKINLDILNPLIIRIMDGPIVSILPEPSMMGKKTVDECLLF